ncbi:MAG: hypothetical protein LQ338_004004 [Usnochroma carphineum]|nr:MAG: hypothetical protein LQ338_004004 [Usnochroma carphineum]
MLAGPTVSTRSSTSSGSRQESIHNGRQTTLPIDSAPDTRSLSHQERYVGFTSTFLHDPEKASPVRYPPSDRPHTSDAFSTYISEEEKDTKEHTVWILVYLSFFSPIVATCISIYTITTVLLLLLLLPVLCLCKPCKPLKQQFHKYLAPPSHFQLSLVCSPPESDTYRFKPEESHVENKGNTLLLIAISILSPLYAAGIAVMAWVAAGFWATSIILGNPDGKDGKDDGKAVVLGVRGLWVRWLRRGLR